MYVFQELILTHIINSSSEFKTNLMIKSGDSENIFKNKLASALDLYLLIVEALFIDLLSEYSDKFSLLKSCTNELSYSVLSAQTLSANVNS